MTFSVIAHFDDIVFPFVLLPNVDFLAKSYLFLRVFLNARARSDLLLVARFQLHLIDFAMTVSFLQSAGRFCCRSPNVILCGHLNTILFLQSA